MIKIRTASFFDSANHIGRCFSIARSQPNGMKFPTIHALVPPWKIVHDVKYGLITEDEYAEIYTDDVLAKTTQIEVLQKIGLAATETITLLCWEREGNFCHRQLVARWIKSALFPDVVVEVH